LYGMLLRGSLQELGRIYEASGNRTEALRLFTRALSLNDVFYADAPGDLGVLEGQIVNRLELGRLRTKLKQWPAAEANFAKAEGYLTPIRKKLPNDLYFLRDDAGITEAKGDLFAIRGNVEQAKAHYREASRMWE